MVPIIAVIFASHNIPSLNAHGSNLPMLVTVLIVPHVLRIVQQNFQLQEMDSTMRILMHTVVSVMVFANIVSIGKSLGFFQAPGKDRLGKPAKPIDDLNYLQGKPVDVTRPGSIKVVEFWATWCAPCKTAIPHLNKIYKDLKAQHGDKIQFVGITDENDEAKIKAFVEEDMAGNMDYAVAIDAKQALSGADAYPRAGIPSAYLVDQEGTIAWSGHPKSPEFETTLYQLLGADKPTKAAVKAPAAQEKKKLAAKAEAPKAEAKTESNATIVD